MSKLFCGVAFNSGGKHSTGEGAKPCRAYSVWRHMIERCYSEKEQSKYPTYIGCEVASEWLDYQNFAEWFNNNEYSKLGYQVDKDLLIPNNKKYSQDTCCFIPQELNTLLTDSGAVRGKYPQGVSFNKNMGKCFASMKINGKRKHLGYFDCPNEAYQTYKANKEDYVKTKALEWKDRIANDVFNALMQWSLSD